MRADIMMPWGPHGHRLTGHETGSIEALEDLFIHLRRIGMGVGASLILPTVTVQFRILLELSIRTDGGARARMLRLAARYAEYAGWMFQESGNETAALLWTGKAVEVADAVGDDVMAVHALVRRALFALNRGDARATVELASLATRANSITPRIRSLAFQREAQGHALGGDYDASRHALDRAASEMERSQEDHEPLMLGSSVLSNPVTIVTGWCLSELGRPGQAAEMIERQLVHIPATARRARARFGLRAALAYAMDGQIDSACALASDLLPDIRLVHSATVSLDLRRLNRTLMRWRNYQPVRELLPELASCGVVS